MSAELLILREPTDDHGCVRFEIMHYPGGEFGVRTEYSWGRLFLREPHYVRFLLNLRHEYEVDVVDVPSYAQMSGTERS